MTDSFSISRVGCFPSAPAPSESASAAEDLDPLDRVDAEVGLQVEVDAQRLLRVAGPLADEVEEPGEQRVAVERAGWRPTVAGFGRAVLRRSASATGSHGRRVHGCERCRTTAGRATRGADRGRDAYPFGCEWPFADADRPGAPR